MLISKKAYIVILIFAFALCIYLIYYMTTEGKQCLANPYVYGAEKMGNIECSCYQDRIGFCDPRFTFNDSGFYPIKVQCDSQVATGDEPNFENLTINFSR